MRRAEYRTSLLCDCSSTGARLCVARSGVLSVWSVAALSFVGLLSFLVLDLWLLSGLMQQARNCCESAAVAAAHKWLADDLLRSGYQQFQVDGRQATCTDAALDQAGWYSERSQLPPLSEADVEYVWRENSADAASFPVPSAVRVRHPMADGRIYRRPGSLLNVSECAAAATASLENRPVAFRPAPGQTLPMLPFSICDDPGAAGAGWWTSQIEQLGGADEVSWNSEQRIFEQGPDGIPEISVELTTEPSGSPDELSLLDFSGGDQTAARPLKRQIEEGLRFADLEVLGWKELALPAVFPALQPQAEQLAELQVELASGRMEPSLLMLCSRLASGGVSLQRAVAVRVVNAVQSDVQTVRLRFQPCVMVTSMAVTGSPETSENRYVYSVRLAN
ncbi:MAG: hypothetical protein ACK5A1_02220 [Planctomyces sp.]|jgi:hypothetical protein